MSHGELHQYKLLLEHDRLITLSQQISPQAGRFLREIKVPLEKLNRDGIDDSYSYLISFSYGRLEYTAQKREGPVCWKKTQKRTFEVIEFTYVTIAPATQSFYLAIASVVSCQAITEDTTSDLLKANQGIVIAEMINLFVRTRSVLCIRKERSKKSKLSWKGSLSRRCSLSFISS